MEFHSSQGDLPRIPDDLTIPQFFLDAEHWHELRPAWPEGAPWVIADKRVKGGGWKRYVAHSVICLLRPALTGRVVIF